MPQTSYRLIFIGPGGVQIGILTHSIEWAIDQFMRNRDPRLWHRLVAEPVT